MLTKIRSLEYCPVTLKRTFHVVWTEHLKGQAAGTSLLTEPAVWTFLNLLTNAYICVIALGLRPFIITSRWSCGEMGLIRSHMPWLGIGHLSEAEVGYSLWLYSSIQQILQAWLLFARHVLDTEGTMLHGADMIPSLKQLPVQEASDQANSNNEWWASRQGKYRGVGTWSKENIQTGRLLQFLLFSGKIQVLELTPQATGQTPKGTDESWLCYRLCSSRTLLSSHGHSPPISLSPRGHLPPSYFYPRGHWGSDPHDAVGRFHPQKPQHEEAQWLAQGHVLSQM